MSQSSMRYLLIPLSTPCHYAQVRVDNVGNACVHQDREKSSDELCAQHVTRLDDEKRHRAHCVADHRGQRHHAPPDNHRIGFRLRSIDREKHPEHVLPPIKNIGLAGQYTLKPYQIKSFLFRQCYCIRLKFHIKNNPDICRGYFSYIQFIERYQVRVGITWHHSTLQPTRATRCKALLMYLGTHRAPG